MLIKFYSHIRIIAATCVLVLGIMSTGVVQVATVNAAPVDVLKKCDSQSSVCDGTNKNSLYDLLKNVVDLLLTVVGIISVIMIIIGGFRYTTSGGDAGQTKSARDTIIYAVAGLVIAIMAFAIVNFVLQKI